VSSTSDKREDEGFLGGGEGGEVLTPRDMREGKMGFIFLFCYM
jgi:hypothetical protein